MNFIKQVLFVAVGSALFQILLPWWALAIPALIIGFVFARKGIEAFFSGFVGISLLWLGMAIYIDQTTDSMLSQKIANLFMVKSVWILQIVTAMIGGLTGGFAALTGYSIKPLR